MNFDNYRYFAAAAEELNFTKAARKLFMTQQALSKQIDKGKGCIIPGCSTGKRHEPYAGRRVYVPARLPDPGQ